MKSLRRLTSFLLALLNPYVAAVVAAGVTTCLRNWWDSLIDPPLGQRSR
jgi:hypothetical protein